MKKLSTLSVLFFLVTIFFIESAAQSDITESKRKLILELIDVTGEAYDMDKEFKKGIEDQKRILAMSLGDTFLSDTSLSESERKASQEKMKASMNRMFTRISEQVSKEINFNDFSSRSLFQTYNKHYSEEVLRDLIAFYRTPTGKKVLLTMPSIQADIAKAFESELLPKILKISKEITDEETKEMFKELEKKDVLDEPTDVDNF